MSRGVALAVCVVLLLTVSAYGDDPPPADSGTTVPVAGQPAPDPDDNLLCPYDDCDGSGGGGSLGCFDCSGNGTTATCYTGGRYWADCQGGSICWYLSGAGMHCEPYCGRRRCYNI
jgi:hypothetical protein